jgi:hypothetical protein
MKTSWGKWMNNMSSSLDQSNNNTNSTHNSNNINNNINNNPPESPTDLESHLPTTPLFLDHDEELEQENDLGEEEQTNSNTAKRQKKVVVKQKWQVFLEKYNSSNIANYITAREHGIKTLPGFPPLELESLKKQAEIYNYFNPSAEYIDINLFDINAYRMARWENNRELDQAAEILLPEEEVSDLFKE